MHQRICQYLPFFLSGAICDIRSIFKQGTTGFNSESSFMTHIKAKGPHLPHYLHLVLSGIKMALNL